MVNSTNYATMSYGELVTLNFAFLLAVGEIKPLMDTKRAEEMDARTEEYVAKMNTYGASKDEILACLEKKLMREAPYASLTSLDVDDQTPTEETENNQEHGESLLALSAPRFSFIDKEEVNALMDSILEDLSQCYTIVQDESELSFPFQKKRVKTATEEKDDGINGQMALPSHDTIEAPATEEPAKEDLDSVITTAEIEAAPPSLFVEAAVEIAKKGQIPDYIDVNAPYFVEYSIKSDDEGKLWRDSKYGRNLDAKDLETFRSVAEKHAALFLKYEVMMSTDDFLVYKMDEKTLVVRMYLFPEQGEEGLKTMTPNTESDSNSIPYDVTVDIHKTHRRMKKAIEKAKEYMASVGLSSSPFYDKYEFYDNNASVELNSNPIRVFEDTGTLSEIMSAFETYARLYSIRTVIISEDNCIAVKQGNRIFVLISYFPDLEKTSIPPQKKKRGRKKKSEPVVIDNAVPEENPLITKAVEMTKTLPLHKTTDKNAPYFLQCDFSVTGNGDLFPERTFSRNVDSLDKFRSIHQKVASKFMSTQYSFTEDYTAYMWSGNKTISVFYYSA